MAYQPLANEPQQGYQGAPGSSPPQGQAGSPPATAPPADFFAVLPGYGNTMQDSPALPPKLDVQIPTAADRPPLPAPVPISEAEARAALLAEVDRHCCWGKKAAKEMQFTTITPSNAFHYKLETFTEGRNTKWTFEPYFPGTPVDGPQNGFPPGAWDIVVRPPASFQNHSSSMEVPHTATVKTCHHCLGSRFISCHSCSGHGRNRCILCDHGHRTVTDENGRTRRERCGICNGSGHIQCFNCGGTGRVNCHVCKAQGCLKTFVLLTVTWRNHTDDFVLEPLPDELITGAQGSILYKDENYLVPPIMSFPEQSIATASQNLVAQHSRNWPTERTLAQRHQIRSVPVSEAGFQFKGERKSFFVFGLERQVHAPEYPGQCCCGLCSMM